jgi:nitrite reductase/ring-hydroxylating ferredoxin subunit/Fe-S cluster biogenesis protein NfuA
MTTAEQQTDELERLAEQVDTAAAAARALEGAASAKALALKDAIEAFHKAGITRIVQRLKSDPRGKELLFELVDDPLVYALFSMHGIVRADVSTEVRRVIESVRPYMQSHGGDVELAEVRGDTVYVRLHGACNGCSMSAVTLREGVEEAVLARVPAIRAVEVLPNEPGPALIGIAQIGVSGSVGWQRGPRIEDVPPGRMARMEAEPESILIVNQENRLSAFRNSCAHQGRPLDGGLFDAESGTITCPWHGFCFDVGSGECLTAPQAQLEPFPLKVQDGFIWVRPS